MAFPPAWNWIGSNSLTIRNKLGPPYNLGAENNGALAKLLSSKQLQRAVGRAGQKKWGNYCRIQLAFALFEAIIDAVKLIFVG